MPDKKNDAPTRDPHEYDKGADKAVEKAPKTKESPQQKHDDEDHG